MFISLVMHNSRGSYTNHLVFKTSLNQNID